MTKKETLHGKFKVADGSVKVDAGNLMFGTLNAMRLPTLLSMKDDLLMTEIDDYKKVMLAWIDQAIDYKGYQ